MVHLAGRPVGRRLGVAWLLGLCLAMPQWLPVVEYSRTGLRLMRRVAGEEERPPVGPSAVPLAVLPELYGCTQDGSFFLVDGNRVDSALAPCRPAGRAAAGAAGLRSRRNRPMAWLLAALGVLGLAWAANIPGIVQILRMPGLNMMSHNRLVFTTALAVVALAAIGLDMLRDDRLQRRWWFWLPLGLAVVLGVWCLARAASLPEPIASKFFAVVLAGHPVGWITNLFQVEQVQGWFVRMYLAVRCCAD